MKNMVSLILIVILHSGFVQSQDSLSKRLSDSNIQIRYETINSITNQQLEEYVQYIEETIFDQPEPFMIYNYLKALQTLNSPNIVNFTKQFIVLSDKFEDMRPAEDPLEMKVKATLILFNLGDYSTVDYVFELVQRDSDNINIYVLDALGRILLEFPHYSEKAKTELLFVLDNSKDETSRSLAMLYLNEYSSIEFLTNYLDKFINDPDETIRDQAFCYLFNIKYQGLHNLLLERLIRDSSEVMRSRIADSILAVFGEPADLKAVQSYQTNEQDKTIKAFVGYTIEDFIPPKPEGLGYYDLASRLIFYNDEMFEYDWIQNEETRDYYSQNLTSIIESIKQSGQIDEACSIIYKRILPQLELDLHEQIITEEAYKFIYYYTIYIKEELETEFGFCP